MVELGIGISSYTEITNPLGEEEYGEVEITADGGAIVHTGSSRTARDTRRPSR